MLPSTNPTTGASFIYAQSKEKMETNSNQFTQNEEKLYKKKTHSQTVIKQEKKLYIKKTKRDTFTERIETKTERDALFQQKKGEEIWQQKD